MRDYNGALGDLNKANELGANDIFTLNVSRHVKYGLKDYNGSLKI